MLELAKQTSDTATDALAASLFAGDLAAAERILQLAGEVGSGQLLPLSERLMRRRRWEEAAWLLGNIPARDVSVELKRTLCRNLAAMQRFRPGVYQMLINLPTERSYSIGAAADERPTLIYHRPDGGNIGLSPGNDPLAAVRSTLAQVRSTSEKGESVALCGIGDGYVLHALAHYPPQLFMDMQQLVFVLEPDAQVLLHCLMIHDYTGEEGPIEQQRFLWFVGADWHEQLQHAVLNDLGLGCAKVAVAQGMDGAAVQARLQEIASALMAQDGAVRARVETYYANLSRAELAALFRGAGARRPRVLLLTTRFSTVLQYATRDAAAGFADAGWETRVLIERSPAHRLFQTAIRQQLDEFKPDLLFQIDHLRHEHNGLFPPGLPFVCWIQDHLPNLMNEAAGREVGPLDFVLTDAAATYVHTYRYPAAQLVAMSKLTVIAKQSERAAEVRDEIVFVSNASRTTDQLRDELRGTFDGSAAELEFALECARLLINRYESSDAPVPSTYADVCALVREIADGKQLHAPAESFHQLARWLNHPLNDALYRQQALAWAAEAADALGLRLKLYGKGWESHPRFGKHAAGPVAYGSELTELTRNSAINLQIVPYLCLHQRLLDGIAAGGFFLVREHLSDVAPQALLDLVNEHASKAVSSIDDARKAIPAEHRERLEQLLSDCTRCLCSMGTEDPVEMVRSWEEAQLLIAGQGVLPCLPEVSFNDRRSFRERVERFIGDRTARERVVELQRRSVGARLTYAAGMQRTARQIGQIIEKQVNQFKDAG